MSHDQATAKSAEMLASVDVRELCQALMSVLETRHSSTDTLPLLKPGDNFDVCYFQANVRLVSIAAKDRARYICRHLSTEALTKASAFRVKFDTDADSLLRALRRVFATPKPPVDAYRQFSSRLQLPRETVRDYLGCLRPLVLASFPDQPASLTDVFIAAQFRAGLLDDSLRRKLIKKPNLAFEALLTLVQEYEERYGPSVAAPCYSTSVARKRQTRSVATQTFRNFTRPFRGRQARVAQISRTQTAVDLPSAVGFPNISESAPPFILDTDASDVAIGAVLSEQQTDGLEHPLIFASQTLTRPERNYSTTHKELLAVVTFVKKFHHYLAGKRFILRTDHQALRWLENFKDPTGQLARWQADLLEYSYTVVHRAGKKHQNADALSRRAQTPLSAATYAPATAITFGTLDHSGWASAQASDPHISLIYDRLRQGAPKPSSEEMKGSSWETRCLWSAWNSLRLCDGVLFLQYSPTDPRRFVLPHDAIHPTLSRLHVDLGHAGQARTDTAERQPFWCPNQRRIIQDICNTCPVCAEVKNPNPTQRAPLQPIQAGHPNKIVGVDLMGPMPPSPSGNRYIQF
nr:unnamed protein product [Spirometra erinaceieuropaei]